MVDYINEKYMVMSKETRKLFRLDTAENYSVVNVGSTDFEVYTVDKKFKACVSRHSVIISTDSDVYDKVTFYKLKNFCKLLQSTHYKKNNYRLEKEEGEKWAENIV